MSARDIKTGLEGQLPGNEVKSLIQLVVTHYSLPELRLLVRTHLDELLAAKVDLNAGLDDVTFDLVEYLLRHGLLRKFLLGMKEDRPAQPEVVESCNRWLRILDRTFQASPAFGTELPTSFESLMSMLNRDSQATRFWASVNRWKESPSRIPQVFIIHGDAPQGHHLLAERLLRQEVGNVLQVPTEEIQLDDALDPEDVEPALTAQLLRKLKNGGGSFPELQACLDRYADVFISIRLSLRSSELQGWQKKSLSPCRQLLNYWRSLSCRTFAAMFVCVQYEPPPWSLSRFLPWVGPDVVTRLRAEIEQLSLDPAGPVVLPELDSIKRSHLQSWARNPEVIQLRKNRGLESWPLETDLDTLFDGQTEQPLEYVVEKLRDLLRQSPRTEAPLMAG